MQRDRGKEVTLANLFDLSLILCSIPSRKNHLIFTINDGNDNIAGDDKKSHATELNLHDDDNDSSAMSPGIRP